MGFIFLAGLSAGFLLGWLLRWYFYSDNDAVHAVDAEVATGEGGKK